MDDKIFKNLVHACAISGRKRLGISRSLTGRRQRRTQRGAGVTNIANTTGFACQSLLTFFLHTPQVAIVLVPEDVPDGNGGTGSIWIGGASEDGRENYARESSRAKQAHKIPIRRHASRRKIKAPPRRCQGGLVQCFGFVRLPTLLGAQFARIRSVQRLM